MEKIKVKFVRPGAHMPTYGTPCSAGADLYACLDAPVSIAPGETLAIPTGLAIEIPAGHAGLVFARSSLGTKRGLAPANKVGVIDSDYRGEMMVVLHNHGAVIQELNPGERIAQLIITPVFTPGFVQTEELSDTSRGTGGFGSTGK